MTSLSALPPIAAASAWEVTLVVALALSPILYLVLSEGWRSRQWKRAAAALDLDAWTSRHTRRIDGVLDGVEVTMRWSRRFDGEYSTHNRSTAKSGVALVARAPEGTRLDAGRLLYSLEMLGTRGPIRADEGRLRWAPRGAERWSSNRLVAAIEEVVDAVREHAKPTAETLEQK